MRRDFATDVPIYPSLIAVAFVVSIFVESTAAVEVLLRPLLVAVLIVALAQLTATGLTGSRHWGAVVAGVATLTLIAPPAALALLLVITLLVIRRVQMRRPLRGLDSRSWTKALNLIAVLSVLLTLVRTLTVGALSFNSAPGSAARAGPGPDIYLLMFDAYPRDDTLQRDFGWDNGPFLDSMGAKGFATSSASHSNYNGTALTLATVFNMAHISTLVGEPPDDPPAQFRLVSRLLNHGRGIDILRGHGYEIVALASPVSNVTVYSADRLVDTGGVTDLELTLLQAGLLPDALSDMQRSWLAGSLRERLQSSFAALPAIASEDVEHPRFVFAHFMSPHSPTLFARDGTEQEPWPCFPRDCGIFEGGQRYGEAAVEPNLSQIEWLNGQIEQVASGILANSRRPPVIIVFSDHGLRHDLENRSEMLRTIFMAYTPDRLALFPNDNSPINILPRLLNAYLGEDIELANDESFVLDMRTVATDGIFKLEPWTP